jgi:hypothetical protein
MPLTLKLIGPFKDNKTYEIKDTFEGQINIKVLSDLFTFWKLSIDEINKIKFFIDAKQIKNPDDNFNIKANETKIILVFTSDIEIRNKLVIIFIKEGYESSESKNKLQSTDSQSILPDPEICKPITNILNNCESKINNLVPKLTDEPGEKVLTFSSARLSEKSKDFLDNEPSLALLEKLNPSSTMMDEPGEKVLTFSSARLSEKSKDFLDNELIDLMNIKTVSLFKDNDFKSLISIYLRRPELFGIMAQYVQNGNVLEESLGPIKTIEDLTNEEIKHYESLANKINCLELNISNTVIINKLIQFSGHLNLTLRSILCDIAKNSPNA